jgi:hypothetical protein
MSFRGAIFMIVTAGNSSACGKLVTELPPVEPQPDGLNSVLVLREAKQALKALKTPSPTRSMVTRSGRRHRIRSRRSNQAQGIQAGGVHRHGRRPAAIGRQLDFTSAIIFFRILGPETGCGLTLLAIFSDHFRKVDAQWEKGHADGVRLNCRNHERATTRALILIPRHLLACVEHERNLSQGLFGCSVYSS